MIFSSPPFPVRWLGAAFVLMALLFGGRCLHAQSDQTWINGSGLWDLSSPHWSGAVPWTNGNNAIFGGTGETVTVDENVSVNHLTFNASGFNLTGNGLLGLLGGSIIDIANAAHLATIDAVISSGAITKTGAGTLVLSRQNTFDGDVLINAGIMRLTHGGGLGSAIGTTTVVSGARLELNGGITVTGETLTINGTGGANSSGALQSLTGTNEWAGNILLGAGGSRLGSNGPSATLLVSGVIDDGASTFGLAIRNAHETGQVILSGASTYGGSTDVVVGILKIAGSDNRLPVGTTLNLGNASNISTSTFDLNGFNQQLAGLGSFGSAMLRTITNTSATSSTLTVEAAFSTAVSAVFSGNLSLVKAGTGTLTLNGQPDAANPGIFFPNTFSGGITVNAGTLTLAGPNAIGGDITVNNISTTLNLNEANTFGGRVIVNAGAAIVNHALGLGNTAGITEVRSGANGRLILGNGVTVAGETIQIAGGGDNNGALQSAAGGTATWAGPVIAASGSRLGGGVGGTLNIDGVISGGGGGGILFGRGSNSTTVLNAVNTYAGPTSMFANGGTGARLVLGVDNAIPATSALNTIGALATQPMRLDLNGKVLTLAGLDSAANHAGGVFLEVTTGLAASSTLTISSATIYNFSGLISDGTGTLHLIKEGTGTQRFFGNHTYTGTTTVRAGTLQIGLGTAAAPFGSNGRLASPDLQLEGGILRLDNLGLSNNSADRLADAAVLTFRGGSLVYAGSDQAATNSTETVDALAFARGIAPVTISYGGTNMALFTAGELLRSAGGGLGFINGLNLGADGTSISGIARLFVTAPPTLVGTTAALSTGINAAAKDTSIVPYLLGVATTTSGGTGTAGTVPNTFLTYHPDTGLRPLNPTDEFTSNAIVAGHNTRVTAATAVTTSTSINSLVLEGSAFSLSIASGNTLTVESGAILFASGSEPRIDGPGTLNFGSREGIITINSTGNTFLTAPMTGSGGITYHGTGTLVLGGQQNSYTGDTVLRVANVIPQASSLGPAGAPTSGAFGRGRLILDGSTIRATTGAPITIANELVIRADTTIPAATPAQNLIFTGPVTLEGGDRLITHQSSANTVFAGVIGDGGNDLALRVAGTGTGAVVLSGDNTYSGGTSVEGTTLLVNNTSGSGTGTGDVTVGNTGTLGGTGTIGGDLTTVGAGGRLSAGVPGVAGGVGTLTFSEALTTEAGSTWLVDIVQDQNGVSDRVNVGGALNLDGASFLPNFTGDFTNGHVYTIASYGSLSGTFDGWADGAVISNYQISYGSGTAGVITLTAVPEPGTLALLGTALGGLFWRRLRRLRAAGRGSE